MANNSAAANTDHGDDHNNSTTTTTIQRRPQLGKVVTLSSNRLTNYGALESLTIVASLGGGERRSARFRAPTTFFSDRTDRALERPLRLGNRASHQSGSLHVSHSRCGGCCCCFLWLVVDLSTCRLVGTQVVVES
jgi:hypothetical protein